MAQPPQTTDIPALERALTQIRGIAAVRIVAAPTGVIEEIHVVGPPERSPKQVVRDVETMLYVQHGIRVDHRKISLVQIDPQRLPASTARVALLQIMPRLEDETPTVFVTLGFNDIQTQGIGTSRTNHLASPDELAAYATTHALDQLVSPYSHIRLESLAQHPVGQVQTCCVHVSLITENSLETLLGISLVGDDPLAAAVRAVLDAVNRRLPRLLSEV